ncbi:MAG: DNA polymerase III subunit delta [Bacteroidaceae bacterium]|nr:DNA polymerase III subunit delta [Bacteroidaceae bacterium]
MLFKEIVGQNSISSRLLADAGSGRVPHALLLCGQKGTGKLQLALAFANYLLCDTKNGSDACMACPSCAKLKKHIHPDLHFVFPVINKGGGGQRASVSDDYISEWRQFLDEKPYGSYEEWLDMMDPSKQAQIFATEGDRIVSKLNLKSSQGGYKIMIIWMPEKMNATCANSLLKIMEEPPQGTLFLLVSDAPDQIIDTILSRCQRIDVPPVPEEEIAAALEGPEYMLSPEEADQIAHLSHGSWARALEAISINTQSQEYLDNFMLLMRLAYARKLKELKELSEQIAGRGREWQKHFLAYCQRMVRENFMYNMRQPGLVYMTAQEQGFSQKFSPFINEKNVIELSEELSLAERHIEQNVNAKVVFFDFILKVIILLKQ